MAEFDGARFATVFTANTKGQCFLHSATIAYSVFNQETDSLSIENGKRIVLEDFLF